ncbi:MAG TPA: RNA-binding protein [bacterium]
MKLYVGNLPFSASAEDVRALFEQAGAVSACELVTDRFTGQSRGFAFVEMGSPEEGAQAIQRFNDHEVDGRRMVVNEARPREARAGGPRGGFGGGGGGYRPAPSGGYGGAPASQGGFGDGSPTFAPPGGGGAPGGFGAKRKSGKGSRRNARAAKRDRKAFW